MPALKNLFRIIGVCLLAFMTGCPFPTVPSVPLEQLLSAPLEIQVGGRVLVLETYLWRDYMPGGPVGGSDLRAVLWITAVDLQPFPADLDADRLWVINGNDIWETRFSGESRPRDLIHPHQLEKSAEGGPRWETGTRVEVVVRLVTLRGRTHLLRASGQLINRTE